MVANQVLLCPASGMRKYLHAQAENPDDTPQPGPTSRAQSRLMKITGEHFCLCQLFLLQPLAKTSLAVCSYLIPKKLIFLSYALKQCFLAGQFIRVQAKLVAKLEFWINLPVQNSFCL
jgi:hypothetical protein